MKTAADVVHACIAELEDKLERAYAEINSIAGELTAAEDEISDLENQIYGLSIKNVDRSVYEFVADAIHRRDVLGLDDGDVLSIIHEKLEKLA